MTKPCSNKLSLELDWSSLGWKARAFAEGLISHTKRVQRFPSAKITLVATQKTDWLWARWGNKEENWKEDKQNKKWRAPLMSAPALGRRRYWGGRAQRLWPLPACGAPSKDDSLFPLTIPLILQVSATTIFGKTPLRKALVWKGLSRYI